MQKQRVRLTLTVIRALQPGQSAWDDQVRGFLARRQKDQVSYVLYYRSKTGRQRWHTIGCHGAPWTPDLARQEALQLLGEVVKGGDPAGDRHARRHAMTVAELCDAYMREAESGRLLLKKGRPKKRSTLSDDRGRIANHIKPLLGRLAVSAVTRHDVEEAMFAIAEGKTAQQKVQGRRPAAKGGKAAATRAVATLGAVFAYAKRNGMRTDNPCADIVRFASPPKDRRLSDDEYRRLGAALREGDDAIRFLALSGWRSSEVATLRWADVDLARRIAHLRDPKSGPTRVLSQIAVDVIKAQPRLLHDNLIFFGARGGAVCVPAVFIRLRRDGRLDRSVTPHVLRHSFASTAGDCGFSELTIAALLGHSVGTVTSRYTHLADKGLLLAADETANCIAALMDAGVLAEAAAEAAD
jgi:integrase